MDHPSAIAPPASEGGGSLRSRLTSESLALKVCVGVLSEAIRVFPEGDTTVTCTATDKAGNTSASASFVVHVNYVIR